MGASQSVVQLIAHDYEIDGIFARYEMDSQAKLRDEWYSGNNVMEFNYVVGSKKRLTDKVVKSKMKIANQLDVDFADLLTLCVKPDGTASEKDMREFIEGVKEELKITHEGYKLNIAVAGNCAPFIDVVATLIKEEFLHPADVNLCITGDRTARGVYGAVKNLRGACEECNMDFVVNEFTPTIYTTSRKFAADLKKQAADNAFAEDIVEYLTNMNSELIKRLGIKIAEHIYNLIDVDTVVCERTKSTEESYKAQLESVLRDATRYYRIASLKKSDLARSKLSDILAEAGLIGDLLKDTISLSDDISVNEKKSLAERLDDDIKWFSKYRELFSMNLIRMPFHAMCMGSALSDRLEKNKAYLVKSDQMDISDEKLEESIEINRLTSVISPEDIQRDMEKVILGLID